MKYLKEFSTNAEYEAYIANTNDLPNVSLIDEDESVKYTPTPPDYSKEYLTFVALEDGTFSISGNNSVDYSLDGGETWATLASGGNTPTIHAGEEIMWKKQYPTLNQYKGFGRFSSTCRYYAEGNVMSLKYGDNFIGKTDYGTPGTNNQCYLYGLFSGSTGLTSAKNLIIPATTLFGGGTYKSYAYAKMFEDCTSLTTAPKLPATTLAPYCYSEMFKNCTSLTTAPELPATELEDICYASMFSNCTSLTTAPELPATTLKNGCYSKMFQSCSSITSAPVLSATTLMQKCYNNMFQLCSNLSYIKMLATDVSATNCLGGWVDRVSTTGTFVKAASATLPTGNSGIPSGWEVINE